MTDAPRSYAIEGPVGLLVVHDWDAGREHVGGPPVLLAHPTGFHGRIWAPVAQRLAAAGRRVWSFDFRGHGDSDSPDPETGAYSWDGFAADALAVVADLGLAGEPALVACGHSNGGAALLLGEALRPGTYPRIWAYEPILFPDDRPVASADEFPLAANARRRRNEWTSTDEVFAAYASKPPLEVMAPESLRAYVDYALRDRGDGILELKCRPEVESRVYSMAPTNGAWAALPLVESPVLVACGETSTDIGPRLAERMPRGAPEVWPGCGHFGPQQDPDRCVESILRFASG